MFYQFTRKEKNRSGDVFSFRSSLAPLLQALYILSTPFLPLGPDQAKAADQPKNLIVVELMQPPHSPKKKKTLECISAVLHFSPSSGEWMQTPVLHPPPKESTPTHSDTSTPLMAFKKLPFKLSKVLQPTQTTYESSWVQVLVHVVNETFSRHRIHLQQYNVLTKKNLQAALGSPNSPTPPPHPRTLNNLSQNTLLPFSKETSNT